MQAPAINHHPRIYRIIKEIAPLQRQISEHPLVQQIDDLKALQCFMEHHVFAVWDFVCLIKALFSKIVCVKSTWVPPHDPNSARLLYEILTAEETDILPGSDNYVSHFTLYRNAMSVCGANSRAIDTFLNAVKDETRLNVALNKAGAPDAAILFVEQTFRIIRGPIHNLAASFVFGREGMLPGLFTALLFQIKRHKIKHTEPFIYYLERHVEIDGGDHFPKAAEMLCNLCQDRDKDWEQVSIAAVQSMQARILFFDGIQQCLALNTAGSVEKNPSG